MTATCPNNPDHKEFSTTAHVVQDWKVDEKGNFIEDLGTLQTTRGPDVDNIWTCCECRETANVTED